jgi:hypothetical protein
MGSGVSYEGLRQELSTCLMEYLLIRRLEKHPPNVFTNKLIMTELSLFVADYLRLNPSSLGCGIDH